MFLTQGFRRTQPILRLLFAAQIDRRCDWRFAWSDAVVTFCCTFHPTAWSCLQLCGSGVYNGFITTIFFKIPEPASRAIL